MRFRSLIALLVLVVASAAQDRLCDVVTVAAGNHDSGVTVQKVMLGGKWGSDSATVFLPDKKPAEGVVVFSHSAIRTDSGASVDLLPLALTLAQGCGSDRARPLPDLAAKGLVSKSGRRSSALCGTLDSGQHEGIQQRRPDRQ